MNAQAAMKQSMDMADMICHGYLDDLSDADLMRRAAPGVNHINWQIGHLISSEHNLVASHFPDDMPALPAGFAEKYAKETATCDDAGKFCKKEELLSVAKAQRAGVLKALAKTNEVELDKPSGMEFAPTIGAIFNLIGGHWLMHCGQWVVVRRQLGHQAKF
ncbi:MAG TPA: DinB family protein [Pirellulales bacterium]|jgi:hypothetical protein|nr:DinB family protein [Pirellulales bacterium]